MKFSAKGIDAYEVREKEYQIREIHGFTLRIMPATTRRPDGVKRWEYVYDSPTTGKRRRMSLGTYPDVSLKAAHKLHADARALLLEGVDPQDASLSDPDPISTNSSKTVKDLYEAYIQDCKDIKLNARSIKHKEQRLSAHIVERWGEQLVSSIKKDAAVALIRELAKDTPGTARNVMLAARTMFNWAAEEGWTEERNPFSNVLKRVPQAAANEKDRWLNASEIQHVLPLLKASKNKKKTGEKSGPSIIRRVIMITLYTGQRPGEVAGLKWGDLENRDRYWFITPDVAKNDIGSLLYLTAPVRRLIGSLRGLDPVYVFPPSRGAEGPTLVTSLDAHVERYLGNKYAGLPRWTPHDLRRTCSTHLQRLKCPNPIIAAIQNHKQAGVARIYNRYEYVDEKREWLIKWAWEIRRILRSKK